MARPWYRSRWAWVGGIVFGLGVAAVLAVPVLVPVDRFRPMLVRLIETHTGREVRIGAMSLRLFPTVHIHATNLGLGNPRGFPQGDSIIVRSLDLGVEPRALLSRRLNVTHIAISGVRLNLLRDTVGRTNLDLPAPSRGTRREGTAAATRAPLLAVDRIGTVTVNQIEVAMGSLDPHRRQVTPLGSIGGLNARIRDFDPGTPNWAKGLNVAVDLRHARLSISSLAKPIQVRSGDLVITGGEGRMKFSASLDTMRIDGTATVARLDPLSITFALTTPELDAGRLQRLVAHGGAIGGSAGLGPRRLLARGNVKIDRLILSPLDAANMRGRVSVYTNTVQLDSYALSAYGGGVQGAAALDYAVPSIPAAITARVRGVNLGRMMSALAPGARRITGALDADVRLATALGRDPKAGLTGAGTFAVRNGTFQGMDLKNMLAQTARALQLHVPAGDTAFSYFGGDLRIAQQRVYSDALRLDGEDLEGTARGSLGFDKTLDYTGTGVLRNPTSTTSPAAAAVPSVGQMLGNVVPGAKGATGGRVSFSLRGSFDAPKFALAGVPQLIRGTHAQPQPQGSQQSPQLSLPDLFKLFP